MGTTPLELFFLRLAALLSVAVTVIYVCRLFMRSELKHFDFWADWLGHGGHGIGMAVMGLNMVGVLKSYGPWQIWAAVYGFCAIFFAVRVFIRHSSKHNYPTWWDPVHWILNVLMTVMFVPGVDALFYLAGIAFYLPFTAFYIYQVIQDFTKGSSYPGKLGDIAHVAMGFAMAIMFAAMMSMALPQTDSTPNLHHHNMSEMNMP